MGTETQRFQRRTVLVKRGLQLKYAAVVFAAVVFTAFIVGVGSYYSLMHTLQTENPNLMPDLAGALRLDMVKLVIFLGIMFLVSLFVSHRWAGPIYRFERSVQTVSTGDLTHRVSLRTGDDLMELQDELNAMIASLQRLVQKDRSLAEHLASRIDTALQRLAGSPRSAELEPLREDLKAMKEELLHLTQAFKV
ncbi:MAG: methyl-accepting chemotaxis protein [Elusimicrobiota bacterium]